MSGCNAGTEAVGGQRLGDAGYRLLQSKERLRLLGYGIERKNIVKTRFHQRKALFF
jgi:hypothetical protein